MRIVVSGTHASGKSTLVSDFVLRHPRFTALPDPFELLDEAWDGAYGASFATQLRISATRLSADHSAGDVIAERGPIDFLAYLLALDDAPGSGDVRERAAEITRQAMAEVDLLVVLPLTARDTIEPADDELLALRESMNDILLDLIDDADVIGEHTKVVEITGDRDERLAALESHVKSCVPRTETVRIVGEG
jgi:hypothetical protein